MSARVLSPTSQFLLSVPWVGLALGGAIVACAGLVPPVITFAATWMVIMLAAPIAILAQIAGAGTASVFIGFGSLLIIHLVLFNLQLVVGLIRRDRLSIVMGLNVAIVGAALLWGGWIALQAMGEAWPG